LAPLPPPLPEPPLFEMPAPSSFFINASIDVE
jgi:hypothetical protein